MAGAVWGQNSSLWGPVSGLSFSLLSGFFDPLTLDSLASLGGGGGLSTVASGYVDFLHGNHLITGARQMP